MAISNNQKIFFFMLAVAFIMSGLIGARIYLDSNESSHYIEKTTTYENGFENGTTFSTLQKPSISTPAYERGVDSGKIWSILFCLLSLILCIKESGLVGLSFWLFNFGWLFGYPIYCFLMSIYWLIQTVGMFFHWLLNYCL